jgi:hypothetical protein
MMYRFDRFLINFYNLQNIRQFMEKTMSDTITIPRKALTSIINSVISGFPNPEDPPLPPGPWDPVIRKAFDRFRYQLGPDPNPWRLSPDPDPWKTSIQNSARITYTNALAQEAISSITNLQDIADTLPSEAQSRVAEVAKQRLQMFVDDYCGTPPRKNPFPFPPRDGVIEGFSPMELVVIGTQFESAAANLANGKLQQSLAEIGTQITDLAIAQM